MLTERINVGITIPVLCAAAGLRFTTVCGCVGFSLLFKFLYNIVSEVIR